MKTIDKNEVFKVDDEYFMIKVMNGNTFFEKIKPIIIKTYDIPIGRIFEHVGKLFVVREESNNRTCSFCYFEDFDCEEMTKSIFCAAHKRKDKTSVYFEEIGE